MRRGKGMVSARGAGRRPGHHPFDAHAEARRGARCRTGAGPGTIQGLPGQVMGARLASRVSRSSMRWEPPMISP